MGKAWGEALDAFAAAVLAGDVDRAVAARQDLVRCREVDPEQAAGAVALADELLKGLQGPTTFEAELENRLPQLILNALETAGGSAGVREISRQVARDAGLISRTMARMLDGGMLQAQIDGRGRLTAYAITPAAAAAWRAWKAGNVRDGEW